MRARYHRSVGFGAGPPGGGLRCAPMQRRELVVEGLRSIAWAGDDLVDWVGGKRIRPDGAVDELAVGYGYRFDGSTGLGEVGAVFEALGTKGRLMRWSGQTGPGVEQLREIDRSYYQAEHYDYPLCLLRLPDGREAIAHCPHRYDTLELELLDGTPLTRRSAKAEDIFHARLAASPDGRWLLDNGWVWHPLAVVCVYDVAWALREPAHLSSSGLRLELGDAFDGEAEAATFCGDRLVVCGGDDRRMLSIVELPSGRNVATRALAEPLGSRLMAWDHEHVVALDGRPRLVALADGAVVHRWDDPGPAPRPCPSVNLDPPRPPYVAIDPVGSRFALADGERVVVISR
jgi:hypothetical protein